MNAYVPAEGIFVGRPPCANCGAAYRLHANSGRGWPGACPEAYRPTTPEEAQRGLNRAEQSGDAEAIFIARGEVQRLHRDEPDCGLASCYWHARIRAGTWP